jgi:glutamate carboxypeptidase
MVKMKKYLDFLENEESNILNMIGQIVELESPTKDKLRNDYLAEIIRDLFIHYTGGEVEIIENDQYGNHLRGTFGEGEEQVLIVGHFDTVHPVGSIKKSPFKVEGGAAYGPGIYDMKTGLIQVIFALSAIKNIGATLNKKVVCLFNADEEIGSVSSRHLLKEEAAKSKYAFILEPSFGEQGAIKVARKGVGSYKLKVSGKSAHAGLCPEEGESAIEEISHQVIDLQSLNDYQAGISVNCGLIHGGSSKNTIPEYAEMTIDVRGSTKEDSDKLHHYISNLKPNNPHTEVKVEGGFTRPPMEKDEDSDKLYVLAKRLMADHCSLPLPEAFVGGASDGNITSTLVPTLDGLGAVGAEAHSDEEHIYTKHLVPRTALLAALLEYC